MYIYMHMNTNERGHAVEGHGREEEERKGGVTRVAVLHSVVYMFVHMGERGRRCSAV